jgi:hypothetical protein
MSSRIALTASGALLFVVLVPQGVRSAPVKANCTWPGKGTGNSWIVVEGLNGGNPSVPDPCGDLLCGDYTVTIRDGSGGGGAPIVGSNVVIDFSACAGNTAADRDFVIACTQASDETSLSGPMVQGSTVGGGVFTFRVIGAANGAATANNTTSPGNPVSNQCAVLYADNVPITTITPVAYDIIGNNGANAADAALALAESNKVALSASPRSRDDENFSGTVTAADAAILLRESNETALGTGSRTTGPYCP